MAVLAGIQKALDAIKRVVSHADMTISRAALTEIERKVAVIDGLTNNPVVKEEGRYLVARALGRYRDAPARTEVSSGVWSARLPGAVARYEFALRRAGILMRSGARRRRNKDKPNTTVRT